MKEDSTPSANNSVLLLKDVASHHCCPSVNDAHPVLTAVVEYGKGCLYCVGDGDVNVCNQLLLLCPVVNIDYIPSFIGDLNGVTTHIDPQG